MSYEDLTHDELLAERDEWTQRSLQWADDISQAVEALDFVRAAFLNHGYKQARLQLRRVKHCIQVGVS